MNIRKLLTRLVSLALIAVFLPTVAMADTWYLLGGRQHHRFRHR